MEFENFLNEKSTINFISMELCGKKYKAALLKDCLAHNLTSYTETIIWDNKVFALFEIDKKSKQNERERLYKASCGSSLDDDDYCGCGGGTSRSSSCDSSSNTDSCGSTRSRIRYYTSCEGDSNSSC